MLESNRNVSMDLCSSRCRCEIKSNYGLGAAYSSNLVVTGSEDRKLHFWNR